MVLINKTFKLNLYFLPVMAAALPFFAVHLCYLVAAGFQHVPWCFPYWDSCSSISAAARELPEKLLFKALMIPSALLNIIFWWVVNQIFYSERKRNNVIMVLGVIANLLLIVYVVALGEAGKTYYALRRIGVIMFFSLTFICQLLVLARFKSRFSLDSALIKNLHRWQYLLCTSVLAIGVGSVFLQALYDDYDEIEDAIEWVLALLLNLNVFSHYWLWKNQGLTGRLMLDNAK